jgi:hypothetical protein
LLSGSLWGERPHALTKPGQDGWYRPFRQHHSLDFVIGTSITKYEERCYIQSVNVRTTLIALSIGVSISAAQNASRPGDWRTNAAFRDCSGGKVTVGEIDLVATPVSLHDLVRMSSLIAEGTVVKILPSISTNPDHLNSIETDSLVSVTENLLGTLTFGNHTIALAQMGGKTAQCEEVVSADPLVKEGDQYIFFLRPDDRKQPANTSGSPRYFVVGVWSGKAKVENRKIHFLPNAHAKLHEYDNMDVPVFMAILKGKIDDVLSLK